MAPQWEPRDCVRLDPTVLGLLQLYGGYHRGLQRFLGATTGKLVKMSMINQLLNSILV